MLNKILKYGPDAYRAEQAQDLAAEKPLFGGVLKQKQQTLNLSAPSRWFDHRFFDKATAKFTAQFTKPEYQSAALRFDAEMLRIPHYINGGGGMNALILTLWAFGWLAKFAFFPFITLMCFTFAYSELKVSEDISFFQAYWDSFFRLHSVITLPCFIMGQIAKLYQYYQAKKDPVIAKRHFELNRQTGQVIFYHEETEAVEASLPFREFVAEIRPKMNHQGIVVRNEVYIRHYKSTWYEFNAAQLGNDRTLSDAYALWNFIQCYMDTSQALPDIPQLEIWRKIDPASIAADQASGRQDDYWQQHNKWQLFKKKWHQSAFNQAETGVV
ncbi:hypothetical protein [Motilimonas pumila]|uniref:Uncharacterized protein n=1 Tax=Motilimonas pumila TaxID=2303987 RepID=A0A418YBL0_9GAMM|nr:hypothetical protein [Motilimonas pumila]RJG41898.1 hypothetical protein D1Z90_15510 [Motilimonas pumila]